MNIGDARSFITDWKEKEKDKLLVSLLKRVSSFKMNPMYARKGEVIGGGYIVCRVGSNTKRLAPTQWPFEHDSRASAKKQADHLREKYPGSEFRVLKTLRA